MTQETIQFARVNSIFLSSRVLCILSVFCLSLFSPTLSWGHASQALLKVQFTVKNEVLECEIEAHYSQIYCLKSRQAGEVTEVDYPKIVRAFQTDCPVRIDGKLVAPTLKSFSEPFNELGADHHHHHDLDDLRYGKIILNYPLVASPQEIRVKWPLISSKEDNLKITWLADGQREVFTVSNHEPMLLWKRGDTEEVESAGERSQSKPIENPERSTPPSTHRNHHSTDQDQSENQTTLIWVFSGAALLFLFVLLLKKRP